MSLIFRQFFRRFATEGCKPPKKVCEKPSSKSKPKKSRPPSGCISGPSGVHPAVEGGFKIWRNLFFLVCVPLIGMAAYNIYTTYEEPERQPFVKYPYLRIRHKKFPWCGGTDKSFFHNPYLNALPDGYEEEDEE